jgi:hypothetical protein
VERHVDADHTAPGARPDDRAQVEDLDGRGDDVAVRAGELIGQRHDRAARGVLRVGAGLQPAAQVPADDPAGQLLDDQLRGVPAAVAADVHDQRLADHLAAQVAVEVGPALADHVRDVQVAGPALAELVDCAATP